MHFLGTKADYIETLNLQNNDLSKIKLITGSVHKNKDEQVLNLEFFGHKVSVPNKVRSISNDDDELPYSKDDNEYSPKHGQRMSMIFEGLDKNQKDIYKELEISRKMTLIDNTPKLLDIDKSKQDEGRLNYNNL
jgi:hypothetical protein